MATMFESSLSMSSAMRPPLLSTHAPPSSTTSSLPSITCNFDDLRERMASFTDRFDDFIARNRRRLLEEHNQFQQTVADIQETQRLRKKDLEIVAHKTSSYQNSLSKEAAETLEMRSAISAITSQRDHHLAHRDRLRGEIATTSKLIATRLSAQESHSKQLALQSRQNEPELAFWMSTLCLRIEGAGKQDRIKFVFDHVAERDWDRECFVEVDTEREEYRVVHARPKVDEQGLENCVERFNESRDLGGFLKGVRELFVSAVAGK